MSCTLKEICIRNFKGLKSLDISLGKFNVIVGPNGSGKTSFIEFFKFLKKALVGEQRPYVPYLEWWSYRNIVWERKEELPIHAILKCDIEGYAVEYEVAFGGVGGIFRILNERLSIEKIVSIEREGEVLRIRCDRKFLTANAEEITKGLEMVNRFFKVIGAKRVVRLEDLYDQSLKMDVDIGNLLFLSTNRIPYREGPRPIMVELINLRIRGPTETAPVVFLPFKKSQRPEMRRYPEDSPLLAILRQLRSAIADFTILKHPNMKEVRSSSLPRTEATLFEDASNLNNILYKWYSENRKLPERIENVMTALFPGTQIGFELTNEGRIFMKVYERDVELQPPCIPDGFYKVLTMLVAVELKPSLLAIDEIENSLHKEALEYVIDELRDCDSTVIVTTHSPLVVDMVRLENLLIAEKTAEGTVLSRVKDPKKVREKLSKLKITQSESWLYGELPK